MALLGRSLERTPAEAEAAAEAGDAAVGRETFELFEAACAGVRRSFPHLSVQDIATPPLRWFDAALARQVALHIMAERWGARKRRIAADLGRQRAEIYQAIRAVNARLAHPEFAAAYDDMTAAAETSLQNRRTADE